MIYVIVVRWMVLWGRNIKFTLFVYILFTFVLTELKSNIVFMENAVTIQKLLSFIWFDLEVNFKIVWDN